MPGPVGRVGGSRWLECRLKATSFRAPSPPLSRFNFVYEWFLVCFGFVFFPLHECLGTMCKPYAYGGQKRALNALFRTVDSHVGAGI